MGNSPAVPKAFKTWLLILGSGMLYTVNFLLGPRPEFLVRFKIPGIWWFVTLPELSSKTHYILPLVTGPGMPVSLCHNWLIFLLLLGDCLHIIVSWNSKGSQETFLGLLLVLLQTEWGNFWIPDSTRLRWNNVFLPVLWSYSKVNSIQVFCIMCMQKVAPFKIKQVNNAAPWAIITKGIYRLEKHWV